MPHGLIGQRRQSTARKSKVRLVAGVGAFALTETGFLVNDDRLEGGINDEEGFFSSISSAFAGE